MSFENCRIVSLPKFYDERGSLTFLESGRHVPFDIKRIYYLYDISDGASRAGHGHKSLHQLMVAISGSFDVWLDDGSEKKCFHLSKPCCGLYIPPMMWRDLNNFSTGAVCMVLASDFYDENDYYRNYDHFIKAANKLK